MLDKYTFCMGGLKKCEVRLEMDTFTSKGIQLCAFSMLGTIIIADGRSGSGAKSLATEILHASAPNTAGSGSRASESPRLKEAGAKEKAPWQ
mmetsp:Transcript_82317/g.163334  ORF Transcript_82317/g.163334 Transcript_82317/m.163334 type:complete len:92 (+) Transcript_82317:201-476(+)